jgi:hypothetical protein
MTSLNMVHYILTYDHDVFNVIKKEKTFSLLIENILLIKKQMFLLEKFIPMKNRKMVLFKK